ncbi:uncharacterized protein OCT59_011530 [Rhizophagus irregularis]|nr:hypothetical protein OCT59_011530 [Rhizophagus irregularis]
MLNQRNLELYESSKCCRCNVTIETWIHVWICKENDLTIKQIINEADKLKGKDVEMSTDDLKLLQQVTDKSNFNFHSNNQTLKEANMRLHNPVPKDLQVYKPHLQKSLEQLVNGANLQAKLRRSQNETSQTSS